MDVIINLRTPILIKSEDREFWAAALYTVVLGETAEFTVVKVLSAWAERDRTKVLGLKLVLKIRLSEIISFQEF